MGTPYKVGGLGFVARVFVLQTSMRALITTLFCNQREFKTTFRQEQTFEMFSDLFFSACSQHNRCVGQGRMSHLVLPFSCQGRNHLLPATSSVSLKLIVWEQQQAANDQSLCFDGRINRPSHRFHHVAVPRGLVMGIRQSSMRCRCIDKDGPCGGSRRSLLLNSQSIPDSAWRIHRRGKSDTWPYILRTSHDSKVSYSSKSLLLGLHHS
jgi:hypothetical protein